MDKDIVERLRGWRDGWDGHPRKMHQEAAAEILALRERLAELAKAEAQYRYAHDILGTGDTRTGRAWDIMRRAGDAARTILQPSTKESGE